MRGVPVNLASEPLERRRLARRIAGVTALVVLAVTLAHGLLAWGLLSAGPGRERPEPGVDRAEVAERVRSWEREVARIARVADPDRVRATADAVGLANEVVARRDFPWGELFAVLERALPDDVRLLQVQPLAGPDGVQVDLMANAPERTALLEFLEALEGATRFQEVFPVLQERGADGQWRLTVRARYADPVGARP